MKENLLPQVRIFETQETLFESAAEFVLGTIPPGDAPYSLVLSGGSTPAGLFKIMATDAYRPRFDWNKIHFFWGDERWVPPTDPRSNFRMAKENLLDPAKVPAKNIHPIPTSLESPAACAEKYEEELHAFFSNTMRNAECGVRNFGGRERLSYNKNSRSRNLQSEIRNLKFPMFDLILLGLGEDGHTASLFSGDPACEEKTKWVSGAKLDSPEPRITLTFPILLAARQVLFLVSGSSKRSILEIILRQKEGFEKFPAGLVRPSSGKLQWFVDASASS